MKLKKFLPLLCGILAGLYILIAVSDNQNTANGMLVVAGILLILPICSGDVKIQNWEIDIQEDKERFQS